MSQEPVKIIVELTGGLVSAVYAGNAAQPMVDVFIVDHDNAEAFSISHQPLVDFHAKDVAAYTYGGYRLEAWQKS